MDSELVKINWEQQALDAINAISDKLGQGADHFYTILVRQQVIDGSISFVGPILFILGSTGLLIWTIKKRKDQRTLDKITQEAIAAKNVEIAEFNAKQDSYYYKRAPLDLESGYPEWLNGVFITSIVLLSLAFLSLTVVLNHEATKIFNPEFHALKDLMEMMK